MPGLGTHLLADFSGCDPSVLDDVSRIRQAMEEAARVAGATRLSSRFHRFTPCGVTGVVTLRESHLAIHTWPEHGFAAADFFTCGAGVDPWKAHAVLKRVLGSKSESTREIRRGPAPL